MRPRRHAQRTAPTSITHTTTTPKSPSWSKRPKTTSLHLTVFTIGGRTIPCQPYLFFLFPLSVSNVTNNPCVGNSNYFYLSFSLFVVLVLFSLLSGCYFKMLSESIPHLFQATIALQEPASQAPGLSRPYYYTGHQKYVNF